MKDKAVISVSSALLLNILLVSAKSEEDISISARDNETQRVKKETQFPDDKFADARYAGIFAKRLQLLENNDKKVFDHFISAAYTQDEIPRFLPQPLQVLSRRRGPIPKSVFEEDNNSYHPTFHSTSVGANLIGGPSPLTAISHEYIQLPIYNQLELYPV